MNKLNKELIANKKQLIILEKLNQTTSSEYKLLQDKIHLYFDSNKYDTSDVESFIINSFWSKAYDFYEDGGYITNDIYLAKTRFKYEILKLKSILQKNITNTKRALDIGCGNGRYTKKFSNIFDEVIGIDLSQIQIDKNIKKNTKDNINYTNENFITMKKNTLGKFDFVFVGDIFMYTRDKDVEKVFKNLLKLLSKGGTLIIRESTLLYGSNYWKSKDYVAYYRNVDFYKSGIFTNTFEKVFRNYGYSLYHLSKFFNVFQEERKKVLKNPLLLENIIKNYVNKYEKSSHFYLYKV